ncbi:X-ray repair cross-complementing protein 5 [Anopheles aquasalis]|uniref:X-ray repair cross-complementing protein 5 n=1 Tax=Anopheles aquasalis TaxID=42839 RepID=UPI00215A87E4|nr:X-ray repair cross-complementing protein 5 [Anopheles aquasalis]
MSQANTFGGNHSDEEDDNDEYLYGGRSAKILAIDCAQPMFEDGVDGKFKEALDIADALMRNMVTNSEKDLVALVLYNVQHNRTPPEDADDGEQSSSGIVAPRQCAIFFHLNTVSVEMIKAVRRLRDSDDFEGFDHKYGHSSGTSLANVLWLCIRMFSHCGYKLEHSTIFLFTMNDLPHTNNSSEHQQSLTKARDLLQKDITIMLLPMVESFDCSKFYTEFLCTALGEDEEDFHPPAYQECKEQLLQRMFTKDFKKRSLAHLKWYLSEDIALAVNIYSFIRKPRFPKKVKLLRSTNEIVESKRVHVATSSLDDGEPDTSTCTTLLPGDQRKCITLGGESISFRPEEMNLMKQILTPGIRLLGFKPASTVTITNHVRSSLFVYPDESHIHGSTVLLRALYEKCLERNQVAYCILTVRRKQPSKLVALVAQEEKLDTNGERYRQPGFRVEFIPYAADIRDLAFLDGTEPPTTSSEQVDVFKKVIKKIKFKYNPFLFENPSSQNLYINLESLVFDIDNAEFFDSTRPDNDMIDRKLDALAGEISSMFNEDVTRAPAKRGRKAGNGDGNDDESGSISKSARTSRSSQ